ncbi:glutathione S-transferase [Haematococcus lacustris]
MQARAVAPAGVSRRCIVARGRAPLRVLAAATPKLRLIYFGLPGRAETIRVLLNVGKIPFEDYTISREQWAEVKPTMPYGQVPVLEVDGKQLAQSSAIERYAARLAGLYPQDAWEAAKVDEIASFMNEWLDAFVSTFSIKDADERLAARKAVAQGPLQTKIAKLNTLLTEAGPDGYLVGGRMTYADVAVYVMTSNIICGFFDGVPRDLYRPFPAITAFHTRMASVPQIRDMYQGVTEGVRMAFKAGAASA